MLTVGKVVDEISNMGACINSMVWLRFLNRDGNPERYLDACPCDDWLDWLAEQVNRSKWASGVKEAYADYHEATAGFRRERDLENEMAMKLPTEYRGRARFDASEKYSLLAAPYWQEYLDKKKQLCKDIIIEWFKTLE